MSLSQLYSRHVFAQILISPAARRNNNWLSRAEVKAVLALMDSLESTAWRGLLKMGVLLFLSLLV